jgi:hypothetical protein
MSIARVPLLHARETQTPERRLATLARAVDQNRASGMKTLRDVVHLVRWSGLHEVRRLPGLQWTLGAE